MCGNLGQGPSETMIADDDLLDLPEDPELAFVQSERRLRKVLFENLRQDSENYEIASACKLEYINHVFAVAKGLELSIFDGYNVPILNHQIQAFYEQFLQDVDHFTVQIRMRHARRVRLYSVALDASTRRKIRHYLEQIKEMWTVWTLPSARRRDCTTRLMLLWKKWTKTEHGSTQPWIWY